MASNSFKIAATAKIAAERHIPESNIIVTSRATESRTRGTSISPKAMTMVLEDDDEEADCTNNTADNIIATSRATTVSLMIFVCYQYALDIVHDDVQIEGIVVTAVVPANAQLIIARYDSLTAKHRCRAYIHCGHLGSNMKITSLEQSQVKKSPTRIQPKLNAPGLLEAYEDRTRYSPVSDSEFTAQLPSLGAHQHVQTEGEDRMNNTAYNIIDTSRAMTVLLMIFVCHQYANPIYSYCRCNLLSNRRRLNPSNRLKLSPEEEQDEFDKAPAGLSTAKAMTDMPLRTARTRPQMLYDVSTNRFIAKYIRSL